MNLPSQALSKSVRGGLSSESLDCTVDVTGNFFTGVRSIIRKRLPFDVSNGLILGREQTISHSLARGSILSLLPERANSAPSAHHFHTELRNVDLFEVLEQSVPVVGSEDLLEESKVVKQAMGHSASTGPEHSHVLTVDQLLDRNVFLAVDDLLARHELLKVSKALRLKESITCSSGEINLGMVRAVGKHLSLVLAKSFLINKVATALVLGEHCASAQ